MKQNTLMILSIMLVMLTGCAHSGTVAPYGFVAGIWHGLIMTWALVAKVFNPEVQVFAGNNIGIWYDAGFVLGAGAFGRIVRAIHTVIESHR